MSLVWLTVLMLLVDTCDSAVVDGSCVVVAGMVGVYVEDDGVYVADAGEVLACDALWSALVVVICC